MEKQPGILDRIAIPSRVVIRRTVLTANALSKIVQDGAFEPGGEATCELEAGGQVVARGRIIARRGKSYFKVLEVARGGEA
jgi:hypothetical protein